MLDNDLQLLLKLTQHNSYLKPGAIEVEQVRKNVKTLAAITSIPGKDIYAVDNIAIPTDDGSRIAIRIYKPFASGIPMPALVYFHGGGFVLYDIDDYDGFCRYIAAQAQITVVAVDYRRAPEHVFPQSHCDAVSGLQWVFNNAAKWGIDRNCIAVGGDSAGGNLAIHATRVLAQQAIAVCMQLLIYPVLGFDRITPSYEKYGAGYFLNKDTIDWFLHLIRNREQQMEADLRLHPRLLPDISWIPPTIMVVAEYDILKDEGIDFYNRLNEKNGKHTLLHFENLGHNFILMAGRNNASRDAVSLIASTLNEQIYNRKTDGFNG
jgi:acetyl esterase/lipase